MNDYEKIVLFNALGKILSNQNEINKHLGINKHDCGWGWSDSYTSELSGECYSIASDYEKDLRDE